MSEIQDPEKKPEKKNDRDFISEKIVRPAPRQKADWQQRWQQQPVPV